MRVIVVIGIPGGAALLVAFGVVLLRLQHMNRHGRPCTDPRQARLIPEKTSFWITFNMIGLPIGLFMCWANPIWHHFLGFLRSLV